MVLSRGDDLSWFSDCLISIKKQSVQLDQLVCVLNDIDLSTSIESDLSSCATSVLTPKLPTLVRLGPALNFGLKHVRGNLIFRFDPDDIYFKNRVETQLDFLKLHPNIDVLGSSLVEFFDINDTFFLHNYPTDIDQILKELPKNNPIAHPSVVIKTEVLKNLDGYRDLNGVEDYDLWLRVLANNGQIQNLSQPLFFYRTNPKMPKRASIRLISSDFKIFLSLVKLNYSKFFLFKRFLLRFIYRLLPVKIKFFFRKKLYLVPNQEYKQQLDELLKVP